MTDFTSDFNATQKSISQALVDTVRSASQVASEDTSFYRSLDPALGQALDRQNARLLSLTERLLRRTSANSNASSLTLSDAEAVESNWRSLVDVTDTLLERADTCLDEYTGLIKRSSPKSTPSSPAPASRPAPRTSRPFRTQNIPKPQLQFEQKPKNNDYPPFIPFLSTKPYAIVPLEQSLEISTNVQGKPQYQHPYEKEIEQFEFPSFVLTQSEPESYSDLTDTNVEFVDTLEGVYSMLDELKKSDIIAIDLEHHDTHSYVGIVSLMQISTRNRDWIVDTLKPWRRKLEALNEVFANPNILKVLHGASMDIVWLQRDLGLYVVGLFDTYHASRALGYAGGSLAFLLKKFIDFDAQKQYQTADWRLRPLPPEMFDYARSDTHFLLHIFDHMRNELVETSNFDDPEQNKLLQVLQRSKETALQRYEYHVYDESQGLGRGGWFGLLQRTPALLSKQEFGVFRKVHQWRDQIARQEDENPVQIIPNHVLFSIAKTLPRDLSSLLNCLHPISQPVRLRSSDLLSVIQSANLESVDGPDMHELLDQISQQLGIYSKSRKFLNKPTNQDSTPQNGSSANGIEASRAESSQFWGSTLPIHDDEPGPTSKALPAFAITPSIPACDVEAFTELSHINPHAPTLSETVTPTYIPDRTLSSPRGESPSTVLGKRKSNETSNLDIVSDAPTSTPRDATDALVTEAKSEKFLEKLQRRAEQKATRKNSPRNLEMAVNGVSNDDRDVETDPFDYTTAPSILNAEKGDPGKNRDKRHKKHKKPFDPYAKASQAASGLGRSRSKGIGKSGTFRS